MQVRLSVIILVSQSLGIQIFILLVQILFHHLSGLGFSFCDNWGR